MSVNKRKGEKVCMKTNDGERLVRKPEKHIHRLVLNARDLPRHLAFDLTFATGSSVGNATWLLLLRHSFAFTSIRWAVQRASGVSVSARWDSPGGCGGPSVPLLCNRKAGFDRRVCRCARVFALAPYKGVGLWMTVTFISPLPFFFLDFGAAEGVVVGGWLLNVPATCECISGMDLLRQFYVLPHWDRSCRSNFPSHPVTVYWHRADQSQCWPYNARRLTG